MQIMGWTQIIVGITALTYQDLPSQPSFGYNPLNPSPWSPLRSDGTLEKHAIWGE